MSLSQISADVSRARDAVMPLVKAEVRFSSAAEARAFKKQVADLQRKLRHQKKVVNMEKREVAAGYTSKAAQVGRGVGSALIGGFFGRRTAGRVNAINRSSVREQKLSAMVPYADLAHRIDSLIHELDSVKFRVDQWLESQRRA